MRPLAALIPAILLPACVPMAQPAAPGVVGGLAGDVSMFPECNVEEFAFVGETTLAALGLGQGGGPDADRVGMVWVTAGPGLMPQPQPAGGVAPPGFVEGDSRVVCVQWPDGSGMSTTVEDGWVPPPMPDDAAAAEGEGTGGPPLGLVALLAGAAVLIGVSVIAFRREPA